MPDREKLKNLRKEEVENKKLLDSVQKADELFGKSIAVSEMVKEGDSVPLFARKGGKYSIDEKHLALMFMKGIQEDAGGRMVPTKEINTSSLVEIKRCYSETTFVYHGRRDEICRFSFNAGDV